MAENSKCEITIALQNAQERLSNSEQQMEDLRKRVQENTEITSTLLAQTQEMVAFYSAMKGAFKVLNVIGAVAKPISAIFAMGAAILAIWTSVKGGS